MSMNLPKPARQVIESFYRAETEFMKRGGTRGGASFKDMAATLDVDVVLHQSPDLPFGGDFQGHEGYKRWADEMSSIFEAVEAKDPAFFERGNQVVIACTLVTKTRGTQDEMKLPMIQLVTVKDEKIVEFRPFYWDVPQYVKAARSAAN